MEFFGEVYSPDLDVLYLKNSVTIDDLPNLCTSISVITPRSENEANIYCIWGAFDVRREEIRHGVRFSLLDCPHALAWTITFDETSKNIIIHCTIDKTETDTEFVDSINEFVMAWSDGIAARLDHPHNKILQPTPKSGATEF